MSRDVANFGLPAPVAIPDLRCAITASYGNMYYGKKQRGKGIRYLTAELLLHGVESATKQVKPQTIGRVMERLGPDATETMADVVLREDLHLRASNNGERNSALSILCAANEFVQADSR